jgi:hypothetical protein
MRITPHPDIHDLLDFLDLFPAACTGALIREKIAHPLPFPPAVFVSRFRRLFPASVFGVCFRRLFLWLLRRRTMTFKFEARPYGPDSTPQEIQAIKDRISVHSPGVLCWKEVPVQSIFQFDLFEQRLNELSKDLPYYDLIIDLTEAHPPSADCRERLKPLFTGQTKMRRVAVFTEKNFMLNIAAKFVLGGSVGLKSFSVYKTREAALEDLRRNAQSAAKS